MKFSFQFSLVKNRSDPSSPQEVHEIIFSIFSLQKKMWPIKSWISVWISPFNFLFLKIDMTDQVQNKCMKLSFQFSLLKNRSDPSSPSLTAWNSPFSFLSLKIDPTHQVLNKCIKFSFQFSLLKNRSYPSIPE